jgi:hypothetical protein
MPALVAGTHVFAAVQGRKACMAGTSPAMTMWLRSANDRWTYFLALSRIATP